LVELINYPKLQLARERMSVFAKGEYDAVLLVYDVANRESFEAASDMYREIPRKNGGHQRRGSFSKTSKHQQSRAAARTVVALVGNKSDFDIEYASVELGLDGPLMEKVAEIQEADMREQELMHPLFRESRFYDDMPSFSPRSLGGFSGGRDRDPSDARRSVMSADVPNQRTSILSSQRSVRTLPEGRERQLPALRKKASKTDKTDAIEKWIETGSPTVEEAPEEAEDLTQVDTQDTDSTTAAKRQVSRLEGEVASQRLQLDIPFFETSAKTGENVEELFEAVVRGVLKEKGIVVDLESQTQPCKRKHGRGRKHEIKLETKIPATFNAAAAGPMTPEMTPASAIDSIFSLTSGLSTQPSPVEERKPDLGGTQAARGGENSQDVVPNLVAAGQSGARRERVMRRVRSLFLRRLEPGIV
jgi:GTPase SAR1 family protein